jgi:hypothetical protein
VQNEEIRGILCVLYWIHGVAIRGCHIASYDQIEENKVELNPIGQAMSVPV